MSARAVSCGLLIVYALVSPYPALVPTVELMRRYHPTTQLDGPLDGFAVPFSLELSRELLGFTPVHTWRSTNGGT